MQYESTFNAIDNILRNEAGCSTELDYIEQTSWLLFLKYLDDLEAEREMNAMMAGKEYKRIITGFMRWTQWAAPKKADGSPDDINCMTGPDLQQFVDTKLFPALRKFQETASSANTLEYKIGEIFAELRNKITSGYNLREIINLIDSLHFQSAEDKHEMTVLYESKIARMGNAGRNGGEYYTPRPLIRTIVKVVNPRIGETVYDPACGSAGFLCEAFAYMQQQVKSTKDASVLQENTFFGKEKKPLPYIIATMNMIFHGVAAPNIIRGNTLAENLSQVQERDRKDVILANPPFGGSERGEVLQNFDLRTSETAYMFMQHFIKMMRTGGRAGIVIKNTFLSNGDAAALRKMLMDQCNLHTILDLPSGVFQGAGVKTVVLFFDKGKPTDKIWYYQLNPGRNLGKTNALNEDDLAEFVELQRTKADSENSWSIDRASLGEDCDLSVKNPNRVEEKDERSSKEILESLVGQLENAYKQFQVEVKEVFKPKEGWTYKKLGEVCNIDFGTRVVRSRDAGSIYPVYGGGGATFKMDIFNREDCMVISRFGMSEQCTRFVKGKFFLNDSGLTLSMKEECMIQPFMDWEILSLNNTRYSLGRGAAQKNLDTKALADVIISYPTSLSQQRAIVARLDSAFAQIDLLKIKLQRTLAECDALKQAMLREVFE